MGWISKRKMTTGHSLNHGKMDSVRLKAPLRKIVETIRVGDGNMFGSGDRVRLECGHEVYSHGTLKARCVHCMKQETEVL